VKIAPRALGIALAAAAVLAGCAGPPLRVDKAAPQVRESTAAPAPLRAPGYDLALEDRILAIDPDRVSSSDVRDTLARGPTPRVMLFHGGIFPVYLAMTSFGRFLVAMGYPEDRIRNPVDRSWSHSPYEDAERLAGIAAWHYERDGMAPLMIGHSQGGMQAVKVLRVLDGAYAPAIPVWNALSDEAEGRTAIVDPFTGRERSVVGLTLGYVSVVAAGGAAFLLPNQWSMIGSLRDVPDTVEAFTGFSIGFDTWAWTFSGSQAASIYRSKGNAQVRNVVLPADYIHVIVPATRDLPDDPPTRAWIDSFMPGPDAAAPPPSAGDNAIYAAESWHDIKRWWVIEAQRFVRARRATESTTSPKAEARGWAGAITEQAVKRD
jgi:hypothetical protein